MQAFLGHVVAYPRTVILLLLLPTAFFASRLPMLEKETDAIKMLPEDHPHVIFSRRIEREFGIRESMVVGVLGRNAKGIYDSGRLAFVQRLTEKLQAMDGIEAGSVKGIFTVDDIKGTAEGFEVVPLLEGVPENEGAIRQLQDRIARNRLLQGEIVARDGTGTVIYADPAEGADKAALYREILESVKSERPDPGTGVWIAGPPVLSGILGVYVDQDLRRMFPATALVVILTLGAFLRTLRGVLLPLLVVLCSVVWTLGAMAILGVPIHSITTALPIVIMALGCADGIHILTRYDEAVREEAGRDRRRIVLVTMEEMWRPVVMTSLTTAVGFLSLLSSGIEPLRHFGIFSAFGVLAAMIFSVAFVPASLVLLPIPAVGPVRRGRGAAALERVSAEGRRALRGLGRAVFRYRKRIILGNLVLAALSVVSLRFLEVDSDPMEYFDPDSEIARANRVLNQAFNGTGLLCLVLDSGRAEGFKSPGLLRKLGRLEERLEQELDDVGGTISLVDYLRRMNRAMHGEDPSWDRLPDTREEVAQYLLLYSMSGDTEDLDRVIDDSCREANLIVRLKTFSSKRVGRAMEVAKEVFREIFAGEGVTCRIGGRAELLHVLLDLIVRGEISSILLSTLGVLLVTGLMFGSAGAGLLCILPITAATLWNFGVMSLFGLTLDAGSAITSCIGIGVGIDYAIHFLSKYRTLEGSASDARALPDPAGKARREVLTARTMETAGRAILFNAMVVICGFLVLVISSFPPTRIMGLMVSLTMFTCLLGALTLLPASMALGAGQRTGEER